MGLRLPTASELPRVIQCPASAVMPRANRDSAYSEKGTAVHAFLHGVRKIGRVKALTMVSEEYRDFCAAIDVTALPIGGEPEVTYAWDATTGKGRKLGQGLGRDYGKAKPTEYVGTADLVEVADGVVRVWDYKTGFYAPEPDTWQLKFLAMAAAEAEGCDTAEVGILKIGDDARVYPVTMPLSTFALADVALRLDALAVRILEDLAGIPPEQLNVHEGEWCKYCPAWSRCPEKTGLVLRMAQPAEIENTAHYAKAELTTEIAGRAYVLAQQYKKMAALLIERVEEMAAHGPVPLPNGTVLRAVDKTRESIDSTIAYATILEKYGVDEANRAVEQKATKASIKRALNGRAAEAIEAIGEAGGIKSTTKASVEVCDK